MKNLDIRRFRKSAESSEHVLGFVHDSGVTVALDRPHLETLEGKFHPLENNPFSYHSKKGPEFIDAFESVEEFESLLAEIFDYAKEHRDDLLGFLDGGIHPEQKELRDNNWDLDNLRELCKKYPLYSQDSKRGDAIIFAKFFYPAGSATWYVLEGEPQEDGNILFFGYVSGLTPGGDEYGYFSLQEFEELRGPFFIERDSYWTPKKISEVFPDLWDDKNR